MIKLNKLLTEGLMIRIARTRNRSLADQVVFMLRRNLGMRSSAGGDFKVRKLGHGKYGIYASKPLAKEAKEWLDKNASRLPQKWKMEAMTEIADEKRQKRDTWRKSGQDKPWGAKDGDGVVRYFLTRQAAVKFSGGNSKKNPPWKKNKTEQTHPSSKAPRGGQGHKGGQPYWANNIGDVQASQAKVRQQANKARTPKRIK